MSSTTQYAVALPTAQVEAMRQALPSEFDNAAVIALAVHHLARALVDAGRMPAEAMDPNAATLDLAPTVPGLADALGEPAATPAAPEFNRIAFGLACTVAWTELVQALRADGHQVGDKSGPTVRKWIEDIVRDTFARPTATAAPAAEAEHQRDLLGQAIVDAAARAGIIRADAEVSGPMLLMLCENLADAALATAGARM